MKKICLVILSSFFLLLPPTFDLEQLFAAKNIEKIYLLEKGIGLPGKLEIGDEKGKTVQWADYKENKQKTGLKYKCIEKTINDKTGYYVVLIKCDTRGCFADRNITIGTSVGVLLSRYGSPKSDNKKLKEDKELTLYKYEGIGFGIDEGGIVQAIYIFPFFKK